MKDSENETNNMLFETQRDKLASELNNEKSKSQQDRDK